MRLHLLEATAFGPFAGTVRVDFDELSEAGLFLLTGPTGSGKTSVLDAVCFALYGDVPGDRSGARQLRSDHAEATTAPSVRLDCTLAGRRFRIVRSPAWQRPKKRGEGTTPEQTRVTLTERKGRSWEPVSTRIDEVGHLVTELLGMTLTQFTQVALLPQGDFQAFLRAGADSRQKLLERLFRTARFRDVELWLADRRRELGRSSQQHAQQVAGLLARSAEVLDVALPATWAESGPDDGAEPTLPAWLEEQRIACQEATAVAGAAREEAAAAATAAAGRLRAGQELAERRRRRAGAQEEAARLDALEPDQHARRDRLDAGRRAAPVAALITAEEAARSRAERASARARTQRRQALESAAGVPALGASLDDARARCWGDAAPEESAAELVAHGRREAGRLAARIRTALPQEERRARLVREQERDRDERAGLEESVARLRDRRTSLPERISQARTRVEAAAAADARLPALSEATSTATTRLKAARRVVSLLPDLEDATAERVAAVQTLHDRTQRWLDLREERLAGMAAEIAGRLAAGAECPVCGSSHHPAPAVPGPDAPDVAAEREARRLVDDAEVARESAADRERGLAQALAVAREQAGTNDAVSPDLDSLTSALEAATVEERQTRALADGLDPARQRLAGLEEELRADQERLEQAARRVEALEATLAGREQRLAEIDAELAGLRGDSDLGLPALLEQVEGVAAAAERAAEAHAEAQHAAQSLLDASERTEAAARAAGFPDVDIARSAVLGPDEGERLEAALREYDDRRAATAAVLADEELLAASRAAEPDLDALAADDQQAEARLAAAVHADETARRRRDRMTELATRLEQELDRWAPVREQYALTAHLAAFAEGKSVDNRLQMRLSAYVLAFRLAQVVAAANERLSRMSDERYLLEHTSARGAGDRRGGLGLRVRDAWSGTTRDPATLSGGETFIVSLALALGLADVVTHEAGGAQLDTLFVDEGFGSLDPETLEDVMETLDGLRSGGRVVGLVSHVSEMRDRIPAKVLVRKSPSGSTLTQVNA
ncbi:SMC family ATPase [Nocardioides rotundus]|uniref:AAA family ATPase n=1 Tax=Nocardioides rotundus TaxID=1774216 RepID=UPI0021DAABF7|nr:SMC family ATPase [Nocardioides rotundus]UAL31402.1 SMC family ATPase [Nocardioides rotundus]